MSLPRFKLHPASVREIKSGHYWVTKDRFSELFKKAKHFFIGVDGGGKPVGVFLNDPQHKKIKARFWSKQTHYTAEQFFKDFETRVKNAISRRKNEIKDRENFFVIFSEADELPGLEVLKLGQHLVIRMYASFWENHIKTLAKFLTHAFPNHQIWQHQRSKGSNTFPEPLDNKAKTSEFIIKEFGISYQIFLGSSYDYGIYTDASSLREYLKNYFLNANRFLNLFSYTGAFSLYGNKINTKLVSTSVDLSEKYLGILKENIKLNKQDHNQHELMTMPALDALDILAKEKKSFDLILNDPPPSSSDGKKITSAIQIYPEYIVKMSKLLSPGGHMVLILNHRSTTRDKFKKMILATIQERNLKLSIQDELSLGKDCWALKGFPESDYLKGFVIKHD